MPRETLAESQEIMARADAAEIRRTRVANLINASEKLNGLGEDEKRRVQTTLETFVGEVDAIIASDRSILTNLRFLELQSRLGQRARQVHQQIGVPILTNSFKGLIPNYMDLVLSGQVSLQAKEEADRRSSRIGGFVTTAGGGRRRR